MTLQKHSRFPNKKFSILKTHKYKILQYFPIHHPIAFKYLKTENIPLPKIFSIILMGHPSIFHAAILLGEPTAIPKKIEKRAFSERAFAHTRDNDVNKGAFRRKVCKKRPPFGQIRPTLFRSIYYINSENSIFRNIIFRTLIYFFYSH